MNQIITGVQQVGIGVENAPKAWEWYRKVFGMDVPVFDDEAEARLMKKYTGGSIHSRRAILAMNMAGGGGFEIWQFKSRDPEACSFTPRYGDLGINFVKIKSQQVDKMHGELTGIVPNACTPLTIMPDGTQSFWVTDPDGNRFQVVEGDSWFTKPASTNGGVCGAAIGVQDVDKELTLFKNVLGFTEMIYDKTGIFPELGRETFRRVLLRKRQKNIGAFSRLFGHTDIELLQVMTQDPQKIYEGRFWGDPGFIHLCFDVNNMDLLEKKCKEFGYPFTVDSSSSFDMGKAAGRFSYIENQDGTLIEFVQAHKLPIFEKLGLYLNLQKRDSGKPLPDWMLKTMKFNRVRD